MAPVSETAITGRQLLEQIAGEHLITFHPTEGGTGEVFAAWQTIEAPTRGLDAFAQPDKSQILT